MSSFTPTDATTASLANDENIDVSISYYQLQIIYYTIGTLGMLGNFFVIYVIARSPNMRTKITNMYILNQSTADFMGGFFMVMTSRYNDTHREINGLRDELYCLLWLTRWPLWSIFTVSTYNLILITVERYISVIHAVWHKTSFTKTKAIASMIVIWIFGFVYFGMYMMFPTDVTNGSCGLLSNYVSDTAQGATGIMNFGVHYLIPIIIMVFCYTRMALALRNCIQPAGGQSTKMNRASKNVIKTLILVCVMFVACTSCNHFYYTMFTLGYPADFNSAFYHFTVIMVSLNICVNPFIYVYKYESFKANIRRLFPWLPKGQRTPDSQNDCTDSI